MKASGPDAPPAMAHDTCPKTSSIKVIMRAVVDMSGVIARVNVMWSGWCRPDTHVGDRTPSVQRSSQRTRMSDIADLTERVGCCAPSDLFKEVRKGSTEIWATSL